MAIEIYLGNPPAYITDWIRNHSQPAGHPETRFILEGGTVETYNITGILNQQWMIVNGFFDENTLEWIKTITQADIGNTVTSIGASAFANCYELTSVTIQDSVTSIGENVFSGCSGLTSVTIPNSVTSIGGGAFSECISLMHVIIPDGVTSIGDYAFSSCYGISITIPTSVTYIGKDAFNSAEYYDPPGTITFINRTLSEVQELDNYSWGISNTNIITVA